MAFYKGLSEKNKDKRSSFNGILQGFELEKQAKLVQWHSTTIKTRETRSMAFYNGLSEKSKITTSEARSMAFYKGLSEKSKVHGDDFKNR
ncbi:hypothetical protein T4B_11237 [Trichinella pseudospiralis]|uniref:Uncharacterized protein n=1 Tax=Trichinella pseudospiralis TaxID=6337 RepID=A0A0V1GMA8_TRIPS|nr:hypothetical protein T4B_11237 [Trichinella pseudospiralis]